MGLGVPTPTPRAEHTTVVLINGAGKPFEAALALERVPFSMNAPIRCSPTR
ncbi:MAG TPA: hypothetical protein VK807_20905 [Gemmatimonadaceae bacterium]|nr:hypothetical protein [Gemmatimonadaceae bacterium]